METIPKEFFITRSVKKMDEFVQTIFDHYRREGFPFYPTNTGYRNARFNELMEADISDIIRNNMVNRTTHGINLAWSYFPHAFKVRCGANNRKTLTPFEAYSDDTIFKKLIYRQCKLGDAISDSGIRGMLRMFSDVQGVSNFRPTAAAALYEHYAQKGVVWDMSGGWGGRLLGAIKADVEYYIATEPSTLTHKGLVELGNDYWKKSRFEIRKEGSEVYKPQKNSLSFCFTSPPYFNLEKYADEPSQSFIKFNTKERWAEEFLGGTFSNCYYGLKKGKYMLINLSDPSKLKGLSLEAETLRMAKKVGFTHTNTLSLVLKSPVGSKKMLKFEPVFIFKK